MFFGLLLGVFGEVFGGSLQVTWEYFERFLVGNIEENSGETYINHIIIFRFVYFLNRSLGLQGTMADLEVSSLSRRSWNKERSTQTLLKLLTMGLA